MSTELLTVPAMLYFADHNSNKIRYPEEAIAIFEDQFQYRTARLVNDDVWNGLTFEMVKQLASLRRSLQGTHMC